MADRAVVHSGYDSGTTRDELAGRGLHGQIATAATLLRTPPMTTTSPLKIT